MPIALLLTEPLDRMSRGLAAITPRWDAWIAAEERVIDRTRSLYLFRWWSAGALPLHDLALRVWIDNLAPLRARLARKRDDAPSLLEPALGAAGSITGGLFSPTGAMAAAGLVLRMHRSRRWLLHAVNVLVNGIWIGAAVAGLLAPIGVGFVLPGQVANLEATGRLAAALDRFRQRLTGRKQDPVTKTALEAGDRFAALLAMLLGAYAVLIVDIGPQLWRTADQVARFGPLAETLAELVVGIVIFTVDYLAIALPIHFGFLGAIFALLGNAFRTAGEQLASIWRKAAGDAAKRFSAAQDAIKAWWQGVSAGLSADHPLLGVWPLLDKRLGLVADAWENALSFYDPNGSKYWKGVPLAKGRPPQGGLKDDFDHALAPLAAEETPPAPAFVLPHKPATAIPWSAVGHLARSSHAPSPLAGLQRAAEHRTSAVFAGRMDALLAQPEATLRPAELEVLTVLATRILAPAVDTYVPQLDDIYTQAQAAQLPVLALPESRTLRPQVGALRIRVAGAARERSQAWGTALREALVREQYLVPAGS